MGAAQGAGRLPLPPQIALPTFTLDFVEHERGLVISLEDGEPGRRSGHIVRDRLLNEQGYVILRLWRREAERDLHSAVHRIKAVLEDLAAADSV